MTILNSVISGLGKKSMGYFATQGPCPYGFHIPTKDEWVALCNILTTSFFLPENANTMGTYLKMPKAGSRKSQDSTVVASGSIGYYWSSTPYDANRSYSLNFANNYLRPQSYSYRPLGASIRCFKNEPVAPTDDWGELLPGTIFWSSTDGLISIYDGGESWITIADKNLGATTVYNHPDTCTDDNCGYLYQRGNNYGFAHSGTVTTSSTQVNTTGYGPGNYYSNSTFIIRASSPVDWSSVRNDNLWGGVNGSVPGFISFP